MKERKSQLSPEVLALEQELAQWRLDPVTKRVLEWVRRERESLKEGLALGAFAAIPGHGNETDKVIGQCRAYKALLELEADQLMEENS